MIEGQKAIISNNADNIQCIIDHISRIQRNSLSVCRLACIRWQYSNDVRLLSAAAVIVIDIISVHCIRSIKLDSCCSWAVIKHIEFPPPIWWSMTRASISTNYFDPQLRFRTRLVTGTRPASIQGLTIMWFWWYLNANCVTEKYLVRGKKSQ